MVLANTRAMFSQEHKYQPPPNNRTWAPQEQIAFGSVTILLIHFKFTCLFRVTTKGSIATGLGWRGEPIVASSFFGDCKRGDGMLVSWDPGGPAADVVSWLAI